MPGKWINEQQRKLSRKNTLAAHGGKRDPFTGSHSLGESERAQKESKQMMCEGIPNTES
jgi:hypothetical protein